MLNSINLMGRLVANPELRKTTSGVSTTTFTIACDRGYVKPGAERQTDFFEIVAWRTSAEFACKYFSKGQLIAVSGSLQTRSYEDREGKKRKVYEIVAENLHFAGEKPKETVQVYDGFAPDVSDDFTVIDNSEDLPF